MRDVLSLAAAIVFFVIVFCGIGWLVQGNSFFLAKIFMPQYEAVRRDTMIESRAYSEATTRRLYDLQRQYLQAQTAAEKDAIKAMALHETRAFDARRLPVDLQVFVNNLAR